MNVVILNQFISIKYSLVNLFKILNQLKQLLLMLVDLIRVQIHTFRIIFSQFFKNFCVSAIL